MYASRVARLKKACVTVRDLWKESVSAASTLMEARNCSLFVGFDFASFRRKCSRFKQEVGLNFAIFRRKCFLFKKDMGLLKKVHERF